MKFSHFATDLNDPWEKSLFGYHGQLSLGVVTCPHCTFSVCRELMRAPDDKQNVILMNAVFDLIARHNDVIVR